MTEVICGITFNAAEFSSVHFGLYWQTIQERFPLPPTDTYPIGEVPVLALTPKLRRVWFRSKDQHQFIQLQADKFLYNWRKSTATDQYTEFRDVYQGFQHEWRYFQKWWTDLAQQHFVDTPFNALEVAQYELTYLNHIDSSMGWSSSEDTQKIFGFLAWDWSSFPLGHPKTQQINLEFAIPEHMGMLSLVITPGVRTDDNFPVLICELTARSFDASQPFDQWFHFAHQSVVQSFVNLLQEDIKEAWGFKWLDQ
ncbi:MAG: TIGR04255 family protein [Leptolyngbya sp. Prado105]|nr:TIGR04255 family protein [Leptolyngbya sp. Prado105]